LACESRDDLVHHLFAAGVHFHLAQERVLLDVEEALQRVVVEPGVLDAAGEVTVTVGVTAVTGLRDERVVLLDELLGRLHPADVAEELGALELCHRGRELAGVLDLLSQAPERVVLDDRRRALRRA
jgi:hypothetical protein